MLVLPERKRTKKGAIGVETKGVTCKIPLDLHNRISEEIRETESTMSNTITSWFGYREDPFTGEIAYHSGTDIGAPGGTPILASADGTVPNANAIDSWGGGYGYHIKISHNDTFDTLYAHCSSICVTVGQKVKQGEVIGYVGTTGNSTGNHLHFEVWQNGERTDALNFFSAKDE